MIDMGYNGGDGGCRMAVYGRVGDSWSEDEWESIQGKPETIAVDAISGFTVDYAGAGGQTRLMVKQYIQGPFGGMTIPITEVLPAKGAQLGAIIALFIGICSIGIILVGYFFNFLQPFIV